MTMIAVHAVGKTFPGERGRTPLEVLREVSFTVAAGEFVSIIGPSGCGKTTLLRILHGLEPVTTGSVRSGERLVTRPPAPGEGASSAMIFQQFNLFPWLTVAQNVAFGLEVAALPKAECEARVRRFVKLVGLDAFAGHYPHELSGGMQQRVGIARALALDPNVLLMDEPFGALDALTRAHLQDELLKIVARTQSTVVMVTHDVDEAVLLSDRIVMMTNGPAATIGEILHVELPRPRHRVELAEDRAYVHYRKAVIDFLYTRQGHVEKTAA